VAVGSFFQGAYNPKGAGRGGVQAMGAGTSGPEDDGPGNLYGSQNGPYPPEKNVGRPGEAASWRSGGMSLDEARNRNALGQVPGQPTAASGAPSGAPSWSLPGGLEAGSSGRSEVQKWSLGRGSPLFNNASNLVRMAPKGARAVDSKPAIPSLGGEAPPSRGSLVGGYGQEGRDTGNLRSAGFFARSVSPVRRRSDMNGKGGRESAQDSQPLPMRPTRASLESTNAGLHASINSAHVVRETLALKAKHLREVLTNGSGTANGAALAEADSGGLGGALSSMSLEAQLDRHLEKIRAHISVSERHQLEITTLRQDCNGQAKRAVEAVQQKSAEQELLQKGRQECSELARKARTEQLRVVMLREAFEQEQTRVGESLGRAEAFVCDLVAATEGTRKVEVEEQSLARECVSALSEIHAAEARDELATEAHLAQVRQELNSAEAAMANGSRKLPAGKQGDFAAASAAATFAKVESERHAAALVLAEERRRCHGAIQMARRCTDAENALRKETEAAREKSKAIGKLLVAALQPDGKSQKNPRSAPGRAAAILAPRLHVEQQNEESMQAAEARLRGQLKDALQGGGGTSSGARGRRLSTAADRARECSTSLAVELQQVKAELSDSKSMNLQARSRSPQPGLQQVDPDWRLDLEAAGLQRKIGKVLAAERQSYCSLLEIMNSEPRVEGGAMDSQEELSNLMQQIEALRLESAFKDEEIARLSRAKGMPAEDLVK